MIKIIAGLKDSYHKSAFYQIKTLSTQAFKNYKTVEEISKYEIGMMFNAPEAADKIVIANETVEKYMQQGNSSFEKMNQLALKKNAVHNVFTKIFTKRILANIAEQRAVYHKSAASKIFESLVKVAHI